MSKGFANHPQIGSSTDPSPTNNYLGQLAAANQVQRLVQRYLSLAPVFIGGPANTSLEAPPPQPHHQPPMTNQFQNVVALQRSPVEDPKVSSGSSATMFNPTALYTPTMAAVAEQQSRFYSQIYRTMAIAAVHQQQQILEAHKAPGQGQQQQQQPRPKRRRTSAGNDPAAPPTHLSGEMIRRLREKQKMRNAAAAASAVASVAAVTTSGGRKFDNPPTSSASSTTIPDPEASKKATPANEDIVDVKPAPLMSSRDMTLANLEETVINGQVIPCFNIGGEMRLCFPQILKQILGAFHMEQICLACEELLIHVAPASNQQLMVLKAAKVLPMAAHQCGLITKSDAERLAAFLTTNKMASASKEPGNDDDLEDKVVLRVQHECFGKASGALYPAIYRCPTSKCISCDICGSMLDPQSFVRHLHTDRENQTCHWGFDASHWRSYVHISDAYYKRISSPEDLSPDKAQALLDDIKKRFSHQPKLPRKQSDASDGESSAKRPKLEDNQEEPKPSFRPWSCQSEDVAAATAAAAAATAAAAETARRGHYYQNINRHHIFGEDPSHYVDEVKQSLAGERGLSPRNRDLVMEVLGRLADRVQSAENSRNVVVNELVSLRERFQNLEAELSKKCDELRQLFLLQQSCSNNSSEADLTSTSSPSPPTSTTTAILRSLRKNKVDEDENSNSSLMFEYRPPFSFSREIESLKENLKTQDSDGLRERMLTIETELKKLQQTLKSHSNPDDMANSASSPEVILVREAETSATAEDTDQDKNSDT